MDNKKIAYKVSITTIIYNSFLAVFKLIAGLISHSSGVVSDAVHTFSDVATTIIAMVGVSIGCKKADSNHQYGHERLECIASLILSFILFITGVEIGLVGLNTIISGNYDSIEIPGILALIAALVSIIVKEIMYWYTIKAANKINSSALKADAWHHRSDSISSLGALLGIVLSRSGFKFCDSLAGIIIAIIICKVAIDIFIDATDKLVDKSCDEEKIEMIKKVVLEEKGVLDIDKIKTRVFANKIYVDIEIAADGKKTLNETHEIAERVHRKVEKEFDDIKHIMVHVNPYRKRK
jgi:cation diffusion facilitator family transporter